MKVLYIFIVLLCFETDVHAGWKQFAIVPWEVYDVKLYYNDGNLKRAKNKVKLHLAKGKYPTGKEVEELSVVTIDCTNPTENVKFNGDGWNNTKSSNLLHRGNAFELLVDEVCYSKR